MTRYSSNASMATLSFSKMLLISRTRSRRTCGRIRSIHPSTRPISDLRGVLALNWKYLGGS